VSDGSFPAGDSGEYVREEGSWYAPAAGDYYATGYLAYPYGYAAPGAPVPPARSRFRWRRVALAVALVGSGVAIGVGFMKLVVLHYPKGFNDPRELSRSVVREINNDLQDPTSVRYDPDVSAVRASCIHEQAHLFACVVDYDDGEVISLEIVVSADGYHWVTR
jgi:hypothetical protein